MSLLNIEDAVNGAITTGMSVDDWSQQRSFRLHYAHGVPGPSMEFESAIIHWRGGEDEQRAFDVEIMDSGWVAAREHRDDEDRVLFSPIEIAMIEKNGR